MGLIFETMIFEYNTNDHKVRITADEGLGNWLTLDIIFEKFQHFLHSVGYDYVWIDPVTKEGDTFPHSWVITKDRLRWD